MEGKPPSEVSFYLKFRSLGFPFLQAYCSGGTVLPKPFKLRLVNREAASVNGALQTPSTKFQLLQKPSTEFQLLQTPSTDFQLA